MSREDGRQDCQSVTRLAVEAGGAGGLGLGLGLGPTADLVRREGSRHKPKPKPSPSPARGKGTWLPRNIRGVESGEWSCAVSSSTLLRGTAAAPRLYCRCCWNHVRTRAGYTVPECTAAAAMALLRNPSGGRAIATTAGCEKREADADANQGTSEENVGHLTLYLLIDGAHHHRPWISVTTYAEEASSFWLLASGAGLSFPTVQASTSDRENSSDAR
ncbi:hypothetical protein AXG93_369s1060 [Marchantia polymorpha subsp. ruderalis]|uniref:Uncharacterized protein n=1 Tax=Marchantia polymorpha subsp. ruderalis TaxID=1480154 RepID=A0A176VU29_MARPO|nr:hypothetical protein AXG93_369s1060 [Marchantia polymorpha subsp. ruderalis]